MVDVVPTRALRRVRHLREIVLRNIEHKYDPPNNVPLHMYCTMSDVETDNVVFSSSAIEETLNPQWELNEDDFAMQPEALNATAFTLRVWGFRNGMRDELGRLMPTDEGEKKVIYEKVVDLGKMYFLGAEKMAEVWHLMANTLIVKLSKGLYASQEVRDRLFEDHIIKQENKSPQFINSREKVESTDVETLLQSTTQICMLQRHRKTAQEQIDRLSSQLGERVVALSQELFDAQKFAKRKSRIDELEALCAEESKRLEAERERTQRLRERLIPLVEAMATHSRALLSQKEEVSRAEDLTKKANAELKLILRKLNVRRRKLILQMVQIYPIVRVRSQRPLSESHKRGDAEGNFPLYSIRGITLPSTDLFNEDDERVSTALGYVAHLLLMLSKYLEIPLRYRIDYRSSRSLIRDEVGVDNVRAEYPLFTRGADRSKFDLALQLLDRDIRQLYRARKVDMKSSHKAGAYFSNHILYNLSVLLKHEAPF